MSTNRPSLHTLLNSPNQKEVSVSKHRVWKNIVSSLSHNHMSQTTQSQSSSIKKFPTLAVAGSLVCIFAVGSFGFYQWNQNSTNNKPSAISILDVSKLPTLAEKATARLAYLTGTDTESVKKILTEEKEQSKSNENQITSMSSSSAKLSETSKKVLFSDDLINKAKDPNADKTVYYRETESFYAAGMFPGTVFLGGSASYIPSPTNSEQTTVVEKTYFSANYVKTSVEKDGKIINAYINTPEYSLVYQGGDYAVKSIYTEPQYFTGFGEGGNPEIAFLKQVIDGDAGYKKIGSEIINGQSYEIYEQKNDNTLLTGISISEPTAASMIPDAEGNLVNPSVAEYSYKIWLNSNTFESYKNESYVDGKVISSQVVKKSETIQNPNLKEIFNLSGIEIKSVTMPSYSSINSSDLVTLRKKTNLWILSATNPTDQTKYSWYGEDLVSSGVYDYSKLMSSDSGFYPKDYFQNEQGQISDSVSPLISYSNKDIKVSVLEKEFTPIVYGNETPPAPENARITIDGQAIPAKAYKEYGNITYSFNTNNQWYTVSESAYASAENPPIKNLFLKSISDSETQEITKSLQEINKPSASGWSPESWVNTVPEGLLAGDLQSKKMTLTNITKQPKQDLCGNTIFAYDLNKCIMSQMGGYSYSYMESYGLIAEGAEMTNTTRNLEIFVLDGNKSQLDWNAYTIINTNGYSVIKPNISENKILITFGADNQEQWFVFEKNGKTILTRETAFSPKFSFEQEELSQLVQSMSANKDIDVLQQQLDTGIISPRLPM
jgi:hypothetical protein